MSYTVGRGNFEGRARASGGFGNETGQTDRRGRSGEAEAANRNAINRAAARSAPVGPFKSPVYDASLENLAKLAQMVGPMIASPGIGLASPLARSILSGDPYGAFGIPNGWSSYSPRDVDPMGPNPRGNTGARDPYPRKSDPWLLQRSANLSEADRREPYARPRASGAFLEGGQHPAATLSDEVPGLPFYGTTGPRYPMGARTGQKSSGYGGFARPAPIFYSAKFF